MATVYEECTRCGMRHPCAIVTDRNVKAEVKAASSRPGKHCRYCGGIEIDVVAVNDFAREICRRTANTEKIRDW